MYKLISTTAAALVLVACGDEPATTFSFVDTAAEHAQCVDVDGTEVCFDGPVECTPRDENALDCTLRTKPEPAQFPSMEMAEPTAERVADGLENFERFEAANFPGPVIDPDDLIRRACDICRSCDPHQCRPACGLCAAAKNFAEVLDDDTLNDDDGDDEIDQDNDNAPNYAPARW